MSKDFNWQTGDDGDWTADPVEEGKRLPVDRAAWLKRWGPWIGAGFICLLIIGIITFIVLNRHVEQAEDTTTADVLAAHTLLQRAVLEKDFDLMSALISDDDENWNQMQLELLNLDLFLDRRPMNLSLIPEMDTSPVVILSPDLKTAEVSEQFPYKITSGVRQSETVWLEQTYTYQRQGESWLLVPLPEDENFWGTWNSTEYGEYLKLIYTDRDEGIADYLGARFDGLIGRICSDSAMDCPGNFYVEFRLERRPESVLRLNESYFDTNILATQNIYHFSMPSPTLIGLPVDVADFDAIFQGYANWLAAVMATQYLVDDGPFVEGNSFELALAKWGLEPPPLPLATMPIPQSIPPPPIPFPEEDILVACSQFNSVILLRYNPRTNAWQDELGRVETSTIWQEDGFGFIGDHMIAVLEDSSVLVSFTQFEEEEGVISKLVALKDGQEQLWLESDFFIQLFPGSIQHQFDPSGRKLSIIDQFNRVDGGVDFYAIDLEDCQSGNCSLQHYAGIPFWSPDLVWALLVEPTRQSLLSLQNEQTGEVIELRNGSSPYWLDEENFINVNLLEVPGAEIESVPYVAITRANVHSPLSRTVLLDSAEIATEISGDDPTLPISINSVIAHPDQPDWLFVSAAIQLTEQSQSNFILSFQIGTRELDILIEERNYSLNGPLQIFLEGRLLAVQTYPTEFEFASNMLSLVPLDPEERTNNGPIEVYDVYGLFQLDWSQDGRWIVGVDQDAIRLIAPGQHYDQRITHNLEFCYQAAWVNALTESSP